MESVLGDSLQAICVEGLDNVTTLLADFPQAKLTRVSWMVAASGAMGGNSGSLATLASKVGSEWNLSGLLNGIYAAETMDQALQHRSSLSASESIITKDGVWLGGSWIQVINISKQDSIVERRGLIADLFKKIKSLQEKCDELDQQRNHLRQAQADAEGKRDQLQEESTEKTQHLGELKSQYSAQLAKIEESATRKERVLHDLEELTRQLATEEQK